MKRRDFVKAALAAPFIGVAGTDGTACSQAVEQCVGDNASCQGLKHPLTGKKLPPWKPGEFQVHFIYTGVAESMFWIMPDEGRHFFGRERSARGDDGNGKTSCSWRGMLHVERVRVERVRSCLQAVAARMRVCGSGVDLSRSAARLCGLLTAHGRPSSPPHIARRQLRAARLTVT